jgi:hypothetical protein
MRKIVELLSNAVLLNVESGNEVTVIIGGNDGTLITIDPHGRIHVTPPEGPGDPQVRQAVTSIVQGITVLSRLGAASGGSAGAMA